MSNIASPIMEKSRDAIKSQMRKRCHQGWNLKWRTLVKIASPPNHDSFGCSLMEIFLLTTNGPKYIHDAMIWLCGKCFTNKISSQQERGRFFFTVSFLSYCFNTGSLLFMWITNIQLDFDAGSYSYIILLFYLEVKVCLEMYAWFWCKIKWKLIL